MPIYLTSVIGCSFGVRIRSRNETVPPIGVPFHNAWKLSAQKDSPRRQHQTRETKNPPTTFAWGVLGSVIGGYRFSLLTLLFSGVLQVIYSGGANNFCGFTKFYVLTSTPRNSPPIGP